VLLRSVRSALCTHDVKRCHVSGRLAAPSLLDPILLRSKAAFPSLSFSRYFFPGARRDSGFDD